MTFIGQDAEGLVDVRHDVSQAAGTKLRRPREAFHGIGNLFDAVVDAPGGLPDHFGQLIGPLASGFDGRCRRLRQCGKAFTELLLEQL